MSVPWIRLTSQVPRSPRLPWRPVVLTVALFAFAAVAAAVVWEHLASPPDWIVSQGEGYRAGVGQSSAEFGVVVWFVACTAVPALVLGAALSWRFQRLGWPYVLLLTVTSTLASVVAWRLGELLGPSDPTGRFAGLADGARVPAALDLDAPGALLAWPVATLLATVLVVTFLVPETEEPVTEPEVDDQGWAGFAPAGPPDADPRNP